MDDVGERQTNKKIAGRFPLRILRLFAELAKHPAGLSLSSLSVALDESKNTLAYALRPLVKHGYILQLRFGYRLGPITFRLAGEIIAAPTFASTFRPHIDELLICSGESAYIGVLSRQRRVLSYVDAVHSPQSLRHFVSVGSTWPLYCTAAGKLLLAYADHAWTEDYLCSATFIQRTPQTLTDQVALRRTLSTIYDTGFSLSVNELNEGSTELSAPITDSAGNVIAALTIAGPSTRLAFRLSELKQLIKDIATRASTAAPGLADVPTQQAQVLTNAGIQCRKET